MTAGRGLRALTGAGVMLLAGSAAHAQVWNETGDAGELSGVAQAASGAGTLGAIVGSLSNGQDVDMFRIHISNPAAFSATTFNGASLFDTQLFLFHLNGVGIAANDDAGGAAGTRSTLGAGNTLYSTLAAGDYLIAVSRFDEDAYSAGGLMFQSVPFGAVYGPNNPAGLSPLTHWSGGNTNTGPFGYQIDFTGVTLIPLPPAAWAGLAGLGMIAGMRRLRAARA